MLAINCTSCIFALMDTKQHAAQPTDQITFTDCERESREYGETNDCTVKALAITLNVPYRIAHRAMRKAGRKNRKGTYKKEQYKALQLLGGCVTSITYLHGDKNARSVYWTRRESDAIARKIGITPSVVGQRATTGNIERSGLIDPNKRYYAFTSCHVLAITGGRVQDWTNGRRHRVIALWEIDGYTIYPPAPEPEPEPAPEPTPEPTPEPEPEYKTFAVQFTWKFGNHRELISIVASSLEHCESLIRSDYAEWHKLSGVVSIFDVQTWEVLANVT